MRIPVKEKKRSPPELTRMDNTVMGCQPGTKAMNTRSALWGKEEIDQASRKLQHSFHQDILLYIKKKTQQPRLISIFGFLKRFLSQPSKRMIFLREIKWLNTFNVSLNGTLLKLIIRPYRFWEKTLLFSVTLISLLPFSVRTPRQRRLREKATKDI